MVKCSLCWKWDCDHYYYEKKYEIIFVDTNITFSSKILQTKNFLLYNIIIVCNCTFSKILHKWKILIFFRGQLRYFQCFIDYIDECGPMGEHFTRMEFMENSYDIARDLCNPFSQLHKGKYIFFISFINLLTVFFSFPHIF